MKQRRFQRSIINGLVLHGNQIWFSEFLSFSFVGLLLCLLLGFMGLIFGNVIYSARLDRDIRRTASERINLIHQTEELKGQQRISLALHAFVGRHMTDSTMYQLVALIYHNSQQFGYDPLLMLAVIHVEGVFNARAKGRYRDGTLSGAFGLMQLKLTTAQEVARNLGLRVESEEDLYRPEINIPIGIAYLTRLISMFHSFKLGLMAYNQGPGVVFQALSGEIPYSIEYYNKVLRSYYRFVKIADAQLLAHATAAGK